jgi:hypothetical protein
MFTRLRRKRHIWREGVPVLFKNVITQSDLRRVKVMYGWCVRAMDSHQHLHRGPVMGWFLRGFTPAPMPQSMARHKRENCAILFITKGNIIHAN